MGSIDLDFDPVGFYNIEGIGPNCPGMGRNYDIDVIVLSESGHPAMTSMS